jgi:hypothetical protein
MQKLEDRIYQWFLKRASSDSGKVRTKGIMAKLCADIVNNPIDLRKALKNLQANGRLVFSADPRGEPISSSITVIRPIVKALPHEDQWQSVLEEVGLPEKDIAALRPLYVALEGFNAHHMAVLLAGLRKLRDEQHLVAGQPSFIVSASYLMGSSKLISSLDGKSLRSFGIDLDQYPTRTPYVMVGGGGESPKTVILVENPIAFESAIRSPAATQHSFVCTFGFGLSNSASEYGNQLAGAIETGRAILLRCTEGAHISFNQVLQHPEIHFWGDLDIAGMQIFERIASKIPHLKLSALYEPMIQAVALPAGRHPYVAAVGKAGQKPFRFMRSDTGALLGHCDKWAVDQEIVSEHDLQIHAGAVLQLR